MQKGYSNDPRTQVPRGSANAAYFARRAQVEREQAINSTNEVVAAVHEKLACRYAALATELSAETDALHVPMTASVAALQCVALNEHPISSNVQFACKDRDGRMSDIRSQS